MTLPFYPPELPKPERAGYQFSRGDGRSRTQEDRGPFNVRRRFSAVANAVAFSTILTRAELARFDRFFDEEVAGGSLPFLMPDPATDGWALLTDEGVPLLTDEGVPLLLAETWVCLFGAQLPAARPVGVQFRVTFEIAVMP